LARAASGCADLKMDDLQSNAEFNPAFSVTVVQERRYARITFSFSGYPLRGRFISNLLRTNRLTDCTKINPVKTALYLNVQSHKSFFGFICFS
jgi:hypothetical protein